MLYGEDNPIDGAVLQVILRKAKAISEALGVSVPAPDEAEGRYMQAIVNTVLLRKDGYGQYNMELFAEDENVKALDAQWESVREKAKRNRTIFAQNRLKPEEVMPEWEKAFAVLGTNDDVERFVTNACQALGAPLAKQKQGFYRLPLQHLPIALKERLTVAGLAHIHAVDFHYPTRGRSEFVHRTHPLVSHIADYLTEMAMTGQDTSTIARAGAIYTKDVDKKTMVYLLRLRSRLSIKRTRSDASPTSELLAEEALALAVDSNGNQTLLDKADVVKLMQAKPSKNFAPEARLRELNSAIDKLGSLTEHFEALAQTRAESVLADHRRIREASEAKGTYSVQPQLPVDVMGVYALVPDASGLL
ncbi:MAG: helicase SNF2, partial [Pseudomonadales bacterium]|nr:helicase SNF2 [Pseudomonadales bacterium]